MKYEPDGFYNNGCTGKTKYTSIEAHKQVGLRQRFRGLGKGRVRRGQAYKCRHCGAWHVSSKPKS